MTRPKTDPNVRTLMMPNVVAKTTQEFEGAEPSLLVLTGVRIGRRFAIPYGKGFTIGRAPDCAVSFSEVSVSQRHCELSALAGEVRISDLDSTNGTIVNDCRVAKARLEEGDIIRVGAIVLKYSLASAAESSFLDEMYQLTILDGLTQVHNRRYLEETLAHEMTRAIRYGRSLSLVFFDLDHFKRVNDEHGHCVGDAVLRELAHRVKVNIRAADTLCRYGGEEFAIILPETDVAQAVFVGEKIRRLVKSRPFASGGVPVSVTISAGLADVWEYLEAIGAGPNPHRRVIRVDTKVLLNLADTKLYLAKESGRDCVVG